MQSPNLTPDYASLHEWESYPSQLAIEYTQSLEEGLDVAAYHDLIQAVSKLPAGPHKEQLADVIFDLIRSAKMQADYPYTEPSDLESIQALRKPHPVAAPAAIDNLEDRIHGAWLGRVVGCLLGKTVEGIHSHELIPLLQETGNYPMHRYIRRADMTEAIYAKYQYPLRTRCFADAVDAMPADDDTNYTVLAQELIEKYGRDFTAANMAQMWLDSQPKSAYCTAERVAFRNFVAGFAPPASAMYKNPYREWIGAQIRGDYFGYINPGKPEAAAAMAFRDASISHIKNGIYGEMFAAAMIACAATAGSIEDIILGGLAEIPATSRLHAAIMEILRQYRTGVSQSDCFQYIHEQYDEYSAHGWCHTISNAMIVAASLLYGKDDFGASICMSVQTAFDTDCNGATVGSILGMRHGTACIGEEWTAPLNDRLETSIFGVGTVSISERAKMTLKHI